MATARASSRLLLEALPRLRGELVQGGVLRELERADVADDRPALLDRELVRVRGHEAEAVRDDAEDVAVADVAVGVQRRRLAQRHVERDLALAVAEDAVAHGAEHVELRAAAGERRGRDLDRRLRDGATVLGE